MTKKNEQIIMAVFSITFGMLWLLFIIQIAVIKRCEYVHESQQEVIDKQNAFIDSLMIRNEVLWEKAIELKYKEHEY